MEGDAERCFEAGMDAYVTKPVRLNDFAAALDRWVPQSEEEKPSGKVLDLGAVSALHGDGTAGLVELFVSTSTPQLEAMRQAAAEGKLAELRRLAHSMRGSALYLGAERLAARCEELENALDERRSEPERQVDAIETEFRKVQDVLADPATT